VLEDRMGQYFIGLNCRGMDLEGGELQLEQNPVIQAVNGFESTMTGTQFALVQRTSFNIDVECYNALTASNRARLSLCRRILAIQTR
jgi:hypothetical protein